MRLKLKRSIQLLALTCAATIGTTEALADRVVRRGGMEHIDGRDVRLDDAGVTITNTNGTADFVRWDRVADVIMDRPDTRLAHYKKIAEQVWRARTRLERNDFGMAEPLFERLFETYRGQSSEVALVVAEGLLRCRLSRAAHDSAVLPALEAARIRRALKQTDVYATLAPIIDSNYSLCPVLAPAWTIGQSDSALSKLLRDLETYDAKGDSVMSRIAQLYFRAVQRHLGTSVAEPAAQANIDHPGIGVLSALSDLTATESGRRIAVRERILRDLASYPTWQQAWARYEIGASMLLEDTEEARQAGMISMLHVPAQFAHEQPYLAGLALARVAEMLERAGDQEGASSLRAELQREFPNHPAARAMQQRVSHIGCQVVGAPA